MQDVVMYSTTYCGFCRAAKAFLRDVKGVEVREIDLTGDRAARLELARRTGRRTVPQIFVGETHVGGYDDLRALERTGRLDPLLSRA